MDPDAPSDREPSPEPYVPTGVYDDDDDGDDWRRERSPTPLLDSAVENAGKPRKRLIKKSAAAEETAPDFDDAAVRKRRKEKEEGGSSRRKEKRPKKDKVSRSWSKGGGSSSRDQDGDPEMKEMWDTIAGGDSEVNFFSYHLNSLLPSRKRRKRLSFGLVVIDLAADLNVSDWFVITQNYLLIQDMFFSAQILVLNILGSIQ